MSKNTASVYIMGKKYEVPKDLTIMRALEHAGYRYTRGCGCRGGFCGACGTVYRTGKDYKIKSGLACQTMVEDEMYLAQLPFFPAVRPDYDLSKMKGTAEDIYKVYPEIFRCVGCNSCTKICPQSIDVMNYMATMLRGDVSKVADASFDCLMCGLCASRCPAEIVQYNVAILARRIHSKYKVPKAKHVKDRVEEIKAGKFDAELDRLMKTSKDDLKKLYSKRDMEK